MIASAVHMVVQQSRLDDGSRKIMNITEIGGIQGDVITLQDIFVYKQEGINKEGKITGKFQASGFIPKFIEKLEKKGYKIPRGLFRDEAGASPSLGKVASNSGKEVPKNPAPKGPIKKAS